MAELNRIACKRYADKNRDKRRALSLKWANDNKEKMRDYQLQRKYNLTIEEYDAMLVAQNGVCAICKLPEPQERRKILCVDHCHQTGKVRGLLCTKCNSLLGYARDNPATLEAAISYLL